MNDVAEDLSSIYLTKVLTLKHKLIETLFETPHLVGNTSLALELNYEPIGS